MFSWITKFFVIEISPEELQAKQLIKAIDRGGIPLNPMKVNSIARSLGLEVKTTAPMQETIERIRQKISKK
jgi:hypothetical protein